MEAASPELIERIRSVRSDVSYRTGVAYDLFGNGKTALKFNLGKHMEAFSATNTDLDLNP